MLVLSYGTMECTIHCPQQNALRASYQLCLRSRIGLYEKYYYTLHVFDITPYFSSDVGFTNTVVWSTGQSGAKTKYRVPTVRGQWCTECKHEE